MERKRTDRPVVEHAPVSIRLPASTLDKVDALAKRDQSSRTDVVRRALATYFRLASAILVPVSDATRARLVDLAARSQTPAETLAEEVLEQGVEEKYAQQMQVFRASWTFDPASGDGANADGREYEWELVGRGR